MVAQAGERIERRGEFVVAARLRGEEGALVPAEVGANGDEISRAFRRGHRAPEGLECRQGDHGRPRPEENPSAQSIR